MSEDLNPEIAKRLHEIAEEFSSGKAYIATQCHEQHLGQLPPDEAGNDRWQVNGLHSVTFTYATTPEAAEAYRTDPAREPDLKAFLRRVIVDHRRHPETLQCFECYSVDVESHKRDCVVVAAARIANELTPELCSEIEPSDWPNWEEKS